MSIAEMSKVESIYILGQEFSRTTNNGYGITIEDITYKISEFTIFSIFSNTDFFDDEGFTVRSTFDFNYNYLGKHINSKICYIDYIDENSTTYFYVYKLCDKMRNTQEYIMHQQGKLHVYDFDKISSFVDKIICNYNVKDILE